MLITDMFYIMKSLKLIYLFCTLNTFLFSFDLYVMLVTEYYF